ncbi:hypothetical protein BDZ90DRAFT_164243 [Jaminaea rosea]|uniref:Uncharacterized protein n=1 Tax=Jaminaea rosea TaxID=1569628 RepID=A0A316US88_9BASI|nr:hypothetical protein BDZ90DRAFT_164243 [Jaminaea rosea]PWN28169.1 hypothetical protein BDZ90DRAFT_164243 [Jaminaea rosea]
MGLPRPIDRRADSYHHSDQHIRYSFETAQLHYQACRDCMPNAIDQELVMSPAIELHTSLRRLPCRASSLLNVATPFDRLFTRQAGRPAHCCPRSRWALPTDPAAPGVPVTTAAVRLTCDCSRSDALPPGELRLWIAPSRPASAHWHPQRSPRYSARFHDIVWACSANRPELNRASCRCPRRRSFNDCQRGEPSMLLEGGIVSAWLAVKS